MASDVVNSCQRMATTQEEQQPIAAYDIGETCRPNGESGQGFSLLLIIPYPRYGSAPGTNTNGGNHLERSRVCRVRFRGILVWTGQQEKRHELC